VLDRCDVKAAMGVAWGAARAKITGSSGASIIGCKQSRQAIVDTSGAGVPTLRHARRLRLLRVPPPAPKRRASRAAGGAVVAHICRPCPDAITIRSRTIRGPRTRASWRERLLDQPRSPPTRANLCGLSSTTRNAVAVMARQMDGAENLHASFTAKLAERTTCCTRPRRCSPEPRFPSHPKDSR
jgi:hypothetical protein